MKLSLSLTGWLSKVVPKEVTAEKYELCLFQEFDWLKIKLNTEVISLDNGFKKMLELQY